MSPEIQGGKGKTFHYVETGTLANDDPGFFFPCKLLTYATFRNTAVKNDHL